MEMLKICEGQLKETVLPLNNSFKKMVLEVFEKEQKFSKNVSAYSLSFCAEQTGGGIVYKPRISSVKACCAVPASFVATHT